MRAIQGLGNRLQATLCGIGAANATERKLLLAWEPSHVCGALMEDLWEHDITHPSWLTARALTRLGASVDHLAGRRPVVHITTGVPFAEDVQRCPWIDHYRPHFTLRADLQQRVDEVVSCFGDRPVIGVAIRANATEAHKKSLQYSPPEWYEQRLDELLSEHPGAAVFVSSDEPDITAKWQARWPDVYALLGKGAYASKRGVQDALCDVHLLAGSSYILGSYFSSMSRIAGMLRGDGAIETSQEPAQITPAAAFAARGIYAPV